MDKDDEDARRARAAYLRERIERLRGERNAEPSDEPADAEGPRAFVQRRMREIEAEEQDEG